MNQSEKVELLKNTIFHLYCKEGRSKSYIARLLELNRKVLSYKIEEWQFEQANIKHLSPSNEKFLNRHRDKIISMYNAGKTDADIAEELGISANQYRKMIVKYEPVKEARQKSNLEWVSQKENNMCSLERAERTKPIGYSKNGKFKEIIIDSKYHFKTITAAAKFINVSQTQFGRYLSGECKSSHAIQLVY